MRCVAAESGLDHPRVHLERVVGASEGADNGVQLSA
jgi:uncharacterized Zn-finger protein